MPFTIRQPAVPTDSQLKVEVGSQIIVQLQPKPGTRRPVTEVCNNKNRKKNLFKNLINERLQGKSDYSGGKVPSIFLFLFQLYTSMQSFVSKGKSSLSFFFFFVEYLAA